MTEYEIPESGLFLKELLTKEQIGSALVEGFDYWINNGLEKTITSQRNRILLENGNYIGFENVRTYPPEYVADGRKVPLLPHRCRLNHLSYSLNVYVDIVLRSQKNDILFDKKEHIKLCQIPLMLKSEHCHLRSKTLKELRACGEDPYDPPGYFIINGHERVILSQEMLALNKNIISNLGKPPTLNSRLTVNTSKASVLTSLTIDKDQVIVTKLPSLKTKDEQTSQPINALILYRVFNPDITYAQIKERISEFLDPEISEDCLYKLSKTLLDLDGNNIAPPSVESRKPGVIYNRNINILYLTLGIINKTSNPDDYKEIESSVEVPPDRYKTVMNIIDNDLFPFMNVITRMDGETNEEYQQRIIENKLDLLSILIAEFLKVRAQKRDIDDVNSWSNKRVQTGSFMMEQLFRSIFSKTIRTILSEKDKKGIDITTVEKNINKDEITSTFVTSFHSNKWGVKGMKNKQNITQILHRGSPVDTYSHLCAVDVRIHRTDRQQAIRMVQNSQFCYIDPAYTTESENVGLLKNSCLLVRSTFERDPTIIIRFLKGDNPTGSSLVSKDQTVSRQNLKVMVGAEYLGRSIHSGDQLYKMLLEGRRSGLFYYDMGLVIRRGWLRIDLSSARLICPHFIVNQETQKLAIREAYPNMPMHEVLREYGMMGLVKQGLIEMVDPFEQEYIKLATSEKAIEDRLATIRRLEADYLLYEEQYNIANTEGSYSRIADDGNAIVISLDDAKSALEIQHEKLLKARASRPYTHCLIDGQVILSVAGAFIPLPNHNQAPRNSYQIHMGKQSLGTYHLAHGYRFDGTSKLLPGSTRPLFETEISAIIGADVRPSGETAILAFMAFPYNEEDAHVLRKEAHDFGLGRNVKYFTYSIEINDTKDITERLELPRLTDDEKQSGIYKHIIPELGMPAIGAYIKEGEVIFAKTQTTEDPPSVDNQSVKMEYGEQGIVDDINIVKTKGKTIYTIRFRTVRIPVEGDKNAVRCAQKATIGLRISQIYLPFTEDGLRPDIITNPAQLPSRMTIEFPIEMFLSKYAVHKMTRMNATAFRAIPEKIFEVRQYMRSIGKSEYGTEKMYSGVTGLPLVSLAANGVTKPIEVTIGPCYIQELKHHVLDKVRARGKGKVKSLTGQPEKGRSHGGGIRFGEMERDVTISHGVMEYARERLLRVTDLMTAAICRECGIIATLDRFSDPPRYRCRQCGRYDSIGKVDLPIVYRLLSHYLATAGIQLKLETMTDAELADIIIKRLKGQEMAADAGTAVVDDELLDEQLEEEELENADEQGEGFIVDEEGDVIVEYYEELD